jgi:hypothetical protein
MASASSVSPVKEPLSMTFLTKVIVEPLVYGPILAEMSSDDYKTFLKNVEAEHKEPRDEERLTNILDLLKHLRRVFGIIIFPVPPKSWDAHYVHTAFSRCVDVVEAFLLNLKAGETVRIAGTYSVAISASRNPEEIFRPMPLSDVRSGPLMDFNCNRVRGWKGSFFEIPSKEILKIPEDYFKGETTP